MQSTGWKAVPLRFSKIPVQNSERQMPIVRFTPNLQRHVTTPPATVTATTVRDALDRVFEANPLARGYILDEQDTLRQHIAVFIDGDQLRDRTNLSDAVGESTEIYVMQALSGG